MKYVHLGIDDKFIDFFYGTCNRLFPGENQFFVLTGEQRFRYVKLKDLVTPINAAFLSSKSMVETLKDCEVLVVHYLTDDILPFLDNVPDNVVVVWSGWGWDYYSRLPNFAEWGFGNKSRKLYDDMRTSQTQSNFLHSIMNKMKDRRKKDLEKRVISRFDYFSAPIPEDYNLVKAALPSFGADYLQLNYGTVEDLFQTGPDKVFGNNILVGNSSGPANNHLEIFDLLKGLDLEGRKVFVPLSYGDSRYRDIVISEGKAALGHHFCPLVDFMPLADYIETIGSCGTVFMNHRRQQALGNIGIMMYKGAKVFLNGKGIAFNFFRNRGAHVFDTESLTSNSQATFLPLTNTQVQDNQNVLKSFWGRDVVESNFRKLENLARRTNN